MESKCAYLPFALPEELLCYGRNYNYQKNSIIFRQDDPAEKVFYLKEGEVRLTFCGADGERKIVIYARKGWIFGGEIPLILNKKTYAINAEAITDCLVVAFSKNVFFDVLMKNLDFVRLCLYWTIRKLWVMGKQIFSLSFLSSEKRIVYTLLWLIDQYTSREAGDNLMFRMTQEELAEIANVHRVTAANVLRTLKKDKIIDKKYGKILITAKGKKKLKDTFENPGSNLPANTSNRI